MQSPDKLGPIAVNKYHLLIKQRKISNSRTCLNKTYLSGSTMSLA